MGDAEYTKFVADLICAARNDFWAYTNLFNPPDTSDIIFSDVHLYLIQLVQDIIDGKRSRRNAVSLPPQHGKSRMLSFEATSWIVGKEDGIQVAMTGYSHELTTDFSKQVKARVESPLYQLVFPNTTVLPSYDKQDSWTMRNGSSIRAKSVGRKLTGRKVNWLVIDDAHSGRREAESALARKRVVEWYFGDCLTRLAPKANIFIIGTRWHPQDLIGHLTSEEYNEELLLHNKRQEIFDVTNMEALCTDPTTDPIRREMGEPLFPEVRDKEFLESLKMSMPAYEWESQFQGHPRAAGSGQVDIGKIKKIDIEEVPEGIEWLRGWDLALTTKKTSDYTAGALCAYDKPNDHLYIIDMFHDKLAWPFMKPKMLSIARREKEEFNVNRMGMEATVGFSIGYDEIRQELMGEVKVEKRNPSTDKLMRAQPWLNKVEAWKVSIVRGKWNKDFLDELEVFPAGIHDDQMDAVSISWECFTPKKMVFA